MMRTISRITVLILPFLAVLFTCDVINPGLGEKVDLRLPVVTISSPSADGLYLKGPISFSGTASDDLKVSALKLEYTSPSGKEVITLDPKSTNWSSTIPVKSAHGLSEGQNTITVTITDGDNNTIHATRLVYVDNYAPLVLIETPLTKGLGASTYSDYIDLMGKAYDQSPISSVRVQLLKADGTVLSNSDIADGTNSWSRRFLLNPAKGSAPGTSDAYRSALIDGTYRYQVIATDAAGNSNTYLFHRTDILTAMSPGALFPSITELGNIEISGITGVSGITKAALTLAQIPFTTLGEKALLPDFKYESNPVLTFDYGTLISGAPASSNALSVGASMTITIDPPVGGGAIVPTSIQVKVWNYTDDPNSDPPLVTYTDTDTNSDAVDNIKANIRGSSAILSVKMKNGGTNLPPTSYKIRASASTDQGSNGLSNIEEFLIDSEAPTFDEAFDSGSSTGLGTSTLFKTGVFKLRFSGTHSTNLDRIEIEQSFNGGAFNPIQTINLSGTSISGQLSTNLPSGAPTDGYYSWKAVLYTASGKSATLYRSVTFDTQAPLVSISNFSPVVGAQTVNGNVNLSISASDENGLQEVRYWTLPSGSPAPAWATLGYVAKTNPPYSWVYDSTLSADGNYELFALSMDKAGNINAVPTTKTYTIDQSSDNPSIDIQSIDELGTAAQNLLSNNLQISGTAADDDNLDKTTFAISIDAGAFGAITNPPASNTTNASWRHTFSGLSEGAHTFRLRVADINGKIYTTNTVNFSYDSANPSLSISGPTPNSYKNTNFSITGSASDASGIQSNQVTLEEGANTFTSSLSGGNYSFAVTAGIHAFGTEGPHTITVKTSDIFGKENIQTISYTVDLTAPNVVITSPIANAWSRGTNLTVNGTSSDALAGVSLVEYRIDRNADGDFLDVNEGWVSADNTLTWNKVVSITGIPEGSARAIEVRATDYAGNISTPTARNFGIDQSDPGLTETSINLSSVFKSNVYTLGGNLSDTNQLANISITESKDGAAASTVFNQSSSGLTDSFTTANLPSGGVATGTYDYVLTVTDIAGNTSQISRQVKIDLSAPTSTITLPSPGQVINGSAFTLTGTSNDIGPAGIEKVEARIDVNGDGDYGDGGLENWTPVSNPSSFSYNISLSGMPEGLKNFEIRATDNAGNIQVSSTSSNFMVDQANPNVTETSIGSLPGPVYLNSGFSLSGSSTDSNELQSIQISQIKDGGSPVSLPSISLAAQSNPWSIAGLPRDGANVNNTLIADGVYQYQITVTDIAGRTSVINRSLTVDTQSPDLSITSLSPVVSGTNVNGKIQVQASAIDQNGLQSVRRWILPQANPAPVYTDAGFTAWASTPYTAQIDTTLLSDGQGYKIWIIARDKAGNDSIISQNFTVDQNSDLPSLAITNLDDTIASSLGVDATHNLLESNPKIQGTLSDDDGIDAGTIQIRIDTNNDGDFSDGGFENWSAVTIHGASGNLVNFEYSLSGLGDSIYNFQVRVSDDITKKSGLSAITKSGPVVYFAIDRQAPSLSISSPSNNAIKNTNFTLTGTASDSNGLNGATVIIQDEISATIYNPTISGGSFSQVINLGSLTEGAHSWSLSVTDKFGKTTPASFNFTKDTLAPTVNISSPSLNDWVRGSSLTVSGNAADASSSVASIEYHIDRNSDGDYLDVNEGWLPLAGNWSGSISLSGISEGAGKTFEVRATDASGNVSTPVSMTFGIDQADPGLTESNIGQTSVFRSNVFTLGGNLTDTNQIASIDVTESKDGGPTSTVYSQAIGGTSNSFVTANLPSTGVATGVYSYVITVTDIAGNTTPINRTINVDLSAPTAIILSPTPLQVINGSVFNLSGTASDAGPAGVERVEFRIDANNDGDFSDGGLENWTQANGTSPWNYSVNISGMPEGSKNIEVRGIDNAGNIQSSTTNLSFMIDQANPALTETNIGSLPSPVFLSSNFVLSGSSSDTNGLQTISITQSKDGGAPVALPSMPSVSGTSSAWTVANLPRDESNPANLLIADGVYDYQITITDISGKTQVLNRSLTIDAQSPDLSITNFGPLVSGFNVNGKISVSASAIDTNGLQAVRRWVLPQAAPAPSFADAGFTAWPSTPYTAQIDTTSLTDGQSYKLYIIAKDKAGNESVISQSFTVDQSTDLPSIALTNLDDSIANDTALDSTHNLLESNPKIQGTLSDDDWINASSIEIRIDGNNDGDFSDGGVENWTAVTSHGASGTLVNFEYSVNSLTDGLYNFQVRTSDDISKKAGLGAISNTTAIVYFAIDKQAPTVNISSPLNYTLKNNNFTLSGSASDINGLVPAQVVITDSGNSVLYSPSVSGGSYSQNISLAALPEGPHSWNLTTTDRFGKSSTTSLNFTKDTTAPSVNILTPSASNWYSGATLTLSGTATDTNGLSSVEYSLDSTNGTDGTWNLASNPSNWSALIGLGSLGEGTKTVWVKATDQSGNTSSASSVSFGIDQTLPQTLIQAVDTGAFSILASSSTSSVSSSSKALFTLSGTASDSNKVASVNVTEKKGSDPASTILNATALNANSSPWSIANLPSGGLVDDVYLYTITITDNAGNTTQYTRTIRVDLTPPVITISAPASDGIALNGNAYSLTGTASDISGSGLSLIEYSTDAGTTWTSASGTSNWNVTLNLVSLGEGARSVLVRATDAANNISSTVTRNYYIDQAPPVAAITSPSNNDVFGADFTLSGTASDVNLSLVEYKINSGSYTSVSGTTNWTQAISLASLNSGINTITIRARDIASQTTIATIDLYKDASAPVISFSNADISGTSVLGETNPKILGTITDASAVTIASTYLESYNYGSGTWSANEAWTSLGTTNNSKVFAFTKDLGSSGLNLADGKYRISIKGEDNAQPTTNKTSGVPATANESVIFTIDRNNPSVSLTTPNTGSFQNQDFTVSGTSSDNNTVSSVLIKIDSNNFSSGTTIATSSDYFATWTATASTTGLSVGSHTIYIQSTDGAGKSTVVSRDFTFDNIRPDINFIDPLSGSVLNGAATIKGTSSDGNAVTQIQLRIGKDATWNTLPGVYSWQYYFANVDTYANFTYASDVNDTNDNNVQDGAEQAFTNVWRLYLNVRATDAAGNIKLYGDNNNDGDTLDAGDTPYYIDLDPSQDAPQINIYQPLNNQTVGGAVRVFGIANDDDAVYRVEMSIDLNNDGDYNDSSDYWDFTGSNTPIIAADGDTSDRFENEATWYTVSGTTNWFQVINQFGEYNAASAGQTRTIKVRVRAVDTKNGINAGVVGNPTELTLTFDNTIPIVENILIDKDTTDNNGNETTYSSGTRVSGQFYIVADIKDESGITQIDKVEDGPLTGTTRIDNNGTITSYLGFTGGYYKYRVKIPIDTTTIGSGVFNNTSGTYSMRIRATDNSSPNPFVTEYYMQVQVDNYFPTAAYTNVQAVVGTNYKIQGTATDVGAGSGIVQGLDKVYAWFTKSGNVYNPLASNTSVNLASNSSSLSVKDMTAAGAIQNIQFPNSGYFVGIDKMTEVGVSDSLPNGDADGYLESLTVSGNTFDWWAEINTTNMPDGPMTLNYIALDKAGNATYYTQTLFIRNNGPVISSVTLGTDINGDGDVLDTNEQATFSSSYNTTNFTVRNNRLYVLATVSGGNGTKYYSVKYPNSGGAELNGVLTNDNLTITNFGSIPDGTANGSSFVVRIYDSTPGTTPGVDSLEVSQTINVTIDNVDNTPPVINVSPIGQKYSTSDNDGAKTLGAVTTYSENVYENAGTLYGHVEYAADSLYNGTDADVSGQVNFKGKVQDNQRLQRITATIPGFNGGSGVGVAFNIWTYAGGSLSGTGWTFTQDGSEYLTESKGHVFNWNLLVNTALITNAATNNLVLTLTAYDYNGTPNTASSNLTVDVVPYISSIVRTGLNTNRTKYGAYPLYRGETQVGINGFNLLANSTQDANNWVRVYNTAGTNYDTFSNAQLTTVNTSRDYMELTIPAALRSGNLRISVNAIQDINAVNDNTKTYNKEDDGNGINSTLWNDNRYLSIWSVNNNFNTSDGAVYPSMSMLADGTLYGAWITYASSQAWLGTTGAAPTLQWGTYDPPEFTDLNLDLAEGATLKYSLAFAANHYGGGGWGATPIEAASAGYMALRTANAPNLQAAGNTVAYGIESLNLNQQLWQFYRPKTVRSNGGTDAQDRIHTVYYDDRTKALKYSFMNDDGQGMVKGWMVIDGPTDSDDTTTGTVLSATATRGSQTTATVAGWAGNVNINIGDVVALRSGTNVVFRTLTAWNNGTGLMTWAGNVVTAGYTNIEILTNGYGGKGIVTNGLTASTKAGEYSAIDVDEDGLPVIVYYDTAAQTLRLARADSASPSATTNWTRQAVFNSGDSLKSFTGQHVAIKFDSNGGLHVVAFRSSTGDLIYLYAPDADGGAAYTFNNAINVDSFGSVGAWADITLQGQVPHLSYLNSTMSGTSDGIKYATLRSLAQSVVTSSSTTSVTASTLIGNSTTMVGNYIVFSDGQTRTITAFNSGTGTISWSTALASAPSVASSIRVVSSSTWDHQIIAADPSHAVSDSNQRTNIEVKKNTGTAWTATWGDVAVGYKSDRFELVYLQPEP